MNSVVNTVNIGKPPNTMSLRQHCYLQVRRIGQRLQRDNKTRFQLSYLSSPLPAYRFFSSCQVRNTDGVYSALTEMRVKTPWVEALKSKGKEGSEKIESPQISTELTGRDLTPKKMSDSYHRVVRRLQSLS